MGLLECGLLLVVILMVLMGLAQLAIYSITLLLCLLGGGAVLIASGFGVAAILKRRARLVRAAEAEFKARFAEHQLKEQEQRDREAQVGMALSLLSKKLGKGVLATDLVELEQSILMWEEAQEEGRSARLRHAVAMIRESAFSIANDSTLLGSEGVLSDLGETARSLHVEIRMEMQRFDQARVADMSLTLKSLDTQILAKN